ncbi:MAG: O-antigen ligase family protein, partial [Victivallaceae bacterium]
PLGLWQVWKFARNFEPVKVSLAIFVSLYAVAALGILYFCGSRGSLLALLVMILVAALLMPIHKKFKIILAILFLGGVVGGFFLLQHFGRGLQTMYLRFDYYQAAVKMFADNPFFGSGWNDFFYDYMKLKQLLEIDEAPRVPHNLILSFAAHAGIAGLIGSLLLFFYPMWQVLKKIRQEWKIPKLSAAPWLEICCFLGLTGFWVQAQTEMLLQSPALMIYAIALMLLGCNMFRQPCTGELNHCSRSRVMFLLPILTLLGALVAGGYGVYAEQKFNALYSVASVEGKTPEELWKTNPDEVVMRFKEYKDAAPYSSSAYLLTGDFFLRRGDLNQAEIYFKGALRNAPGNGVIYRRLAQLAAQRNDQKSAEEYIAKALATYPSDKMFNEVQQEIRRHFQSKTE